VEEFQKFAMEHSESIIGSDSPLAAQHRLSPGYFIWQTVALNSEDRLETCGKPHLAPATAATAATATAATAAPATVPVPSECVFVLVIFY
jgi:hypothetical protein